MEINNLSMKIDELNNEDSKTIYIEKYNKIKQNIEEIETILNSNLHIDQLTFDEILLEIKKININDINNIRTLKYYKQLIEKYEELKLNEELKITHV